MANEKENTSIDDKFKEPDWINNILIQKALQNSGEKNLQVQDISVQMATAPGDNYSSSIYRVTVALSGGGSRSFVVKGPAPGRNTRETIAELGLFSREGIMLGEVVPQIESLLEEVAPGRFPPFAARCPLSGSDPVEFLVLEDLVSAGFKLADRKCGLDLRHSLLALQCLARYHAGSHALLRRKPEVAELLPSIWRKPHPSHCGFVEGAIQMAADACRLWPDYEEYAAILDKFKPVVIETFQNINMPKDGEFAVIIHSDIWVNNMMFQYNNEDPEPRGHRMVDFQGSTVGSPALDLLYFISTSVTEDLAANHTDMLLREYHSTLEETLTLLELEAPSLETLLMHMDAHGPFVLMGALYVLPIVRAQRVPDVETGLTGDYSAFSHLYEDPAVKRWMQLVLPEYKRRGWLPK